MRRVPRKSIYIIYIIVALTTSLFMSCTLINWQDISADLRYTTIPGRIFKTNVSLGVYGVEKLGSKTKEIAWYFITDSFDIRGHGTVLIGCLPQGSLLKITGIVQSDEPIFLGENTEFIAEILKNSSLSVSEVHISYLYRGMYTETRSSGGRKILRLNSKIFTEITKENQTEEEGRP